MKPKSVFARKVLEVKEAAEGVVWIAVGGVLLGIISSAVTAIFILGMISDTSRLVRGGDV